MKPDGDHDRDRSAVDGRYVSDEFADANPDITVSEPVERHRYVDPVALRFHNLENRVEELERRLDERA